MQARDVEVGWLIFSTMISMLLSGTLVDSRLPNALWLFEKPSKQMVGPTEDNKDKGLGKRG